MKKKKSKIGKIIFLVFLLSMIVFYFLVMILELKIDVIEAEITNFNDDINSRGFVIRDEQTVDLPSGIISNVMLNFENGSKVAKDSILAKIYGSSNEVKDAYALKTLEENLEKIENKPYSYAGEGANLLNKKITETLSKFAFSDSVSKNRKYKVELWELLNKKAINLGKSDCLDELKKSLSEQKKKISLPENTQVIKAPFCGEFINNLDGFETSFNYSELPENLDVENISPKGNENNALGKIIKSDTWYSVLNISEEEAKRISKSNDIRLSVENKDYAQNIPCEIKSLKKDSSGEKYVLVLSCNYMDKYLASLRKENFRITAAVYHGIKVPRVAIRQNNSIFGVYVKRAGYLKFKRIDIVFSNNDFVIASYTHDNYDDENYLQPGDKIVVSGGKLYDGKKVK